MSIPEQIIMTAARLLQGRAQGYAGRALRLAQREAARTAERLEIAGPRLTALTEAGLRLTELSYRCVDQLARQSVASAQGALLDGTERLRMTARAHSLGALYAEQRDALPASRARIAKELRATWKIVASTGRELMEIAQSARSGLKEQGSRPERTRSAPARKPRGEPRGPRRAQRARRRREQSGHE